MGDGIKKLGDWLTKGAFNGGIPKYHALHAEVRHHAEHAAAHYAAADQHYKSDPKSAAGISHEHLAKQHRAKLEEAFDKHHGAKHGKGGMVTSGFIMHDAKDHAKSPAPRHFTAYKANLRVAKAMALGDWLAKGHGSAVPSAKHLSSMSWHDHFDHAQHHQGLADSAKAAGHAHLAEHHGKMAEMHHEFRLAGQKKQGVSGPYSGALSSAHRASKRKEATGHMARAKLLHSELKGGGKMAKGESSPAERLGDWLLKSRAKAIGIKHDRVVGETDSGKTIRMDPNHADHKKFTSADHADAAAAHSFHITQTKANPLAMGHHMTAMIHHKMAMKNMSKAEKKPKLKKDDPNYDASMSALQSKGTMAGSNSGAGAAGGFVFGGKKGEEESDSDLDKSVFKLGAWLGEQ